MRPNDYAVERTRLNRGRLRKRILKYVKLISVVVMAGIFLHQP